ncbi:hypothetical protein I6B53_05515 [Schaalia sp. 19OD2882]|uniref:hypothetical protein n=1 Tax=Schaalia sp. 19OD2882 TaxID=2794089 RepID=UPI001C1EEDA7|nr:hypothetical protein [Schaalia sp. 19OD2882]QWW20519.1 hypothetical protein I6B53_05515 [Schaalia sp. 19OD2882]
MTLLAAPNAPSTTGPPPQLLLMHMAAWMVCAGFVLMVALWWWRWRGLKRLRDQSQEAPQPLRGWVVLAVPGFLFVGSGLLAATCLPMVLTGEVGASRAADVLTLFLGGVLWGSLCLFFAHLSWKVLRRRNAVETPQTLEEDRQAWKAFQPLFHSHLWRQVKIWAGMSAIWGIAMALVVLVVVIALLAGG